jgi:HAMP domain-containing protein
MVGTAADRFFDKRRGAVMERLPIRTRLILLSGALLFFLFATNFYLNRRLAENSAGMAKAVSMLGVIRNANDAQHAFGEMRYWLTDLAVSLLSTSEQNAAAAREQTERDLERLAQLQPQAIAAVRSDLAHYEDYAGRAVEEYTSGDRDAGNALLAQASGYGVAVDHRLATIAADLTAQSVATRERLIAEAKTARRLSRIVMWTAVLVGASMTLLVLRSIVGPLRRLVVAMNGLNTGDVAVAIPDAGPDEIGAMARTLSAFRDTLQALRSTLARFEALRDVGRAVGSTLDLDAVLNLVVARAVEFSQSQAGVVYDYDAPARKFTVRASRGEDDAAIALARGQ